MKRGLDVILIAEMKTTLNYQSEALTSSEREALYFRAFGMAQFAVIIDPEHEDVYIDIWEEYAPQIKAKIKG